MRTSDSHIKLRRSYREFWGCAIAIRETAAHFDRVRPDQVSYVAPHHAATKPLAIAAVFDGHGPGTLVLAGSLSVSDLGPFLLGGSSFG